MGANAKFSPPPSTLKNRHCLLILASPIEVRPLNPARWSKALPSGVWGAAPAEIEFGAF